MRQAWIRGDGCQANATGYTLTSIGVLFDSGLVRTPHAMPPSGAREIATISGHRNSPVSPSRQTAKHAISGGPAHARSPHSTHYAAMLGAFVVMTVAGAPAELAAEMDVNTETGPNIVVFVSDDMGWGQAGFNGGTDIATTNLDRIADEGVRLTQFYVQPACAPTRASLFTGRYAWKTGAGSNPDSSSDDGLLLDERTVAEALRDSGYATWLVGKWHLGHWGSNRLPLQRGFDHHYGFYNGFIDSYELVRPWRTWYEVFDWHRNGRPVVESGYSTFLLAEEASQLIERHNGSRPFFLYVAFDAPHDPYQAPRKYIRQVAPSVSSGEERKQRAMVKAMDDAIGQVMDALDRKDVLDETLVMFLNDNGGTSEAGGNSPYQGLKRSYLEGGIRVPAVMRWPGQITAASENDSLMHVSDLFPTFAGLAGADTGGGLALDGFDAWEAIANGAESPREEVVHSLDVIRVGDWKLLEEDGAFSKGNQSSPEQLYNIADDPYETTNLASSETAKVAELQERLAYHRPFAREAQPGAAIPGLDGPQSLLADDRPVMFGEEENTAFGAEIETALTQREAGNLGPKLLWIEASGDQVKMVYDETLAADSVPPAGAFKVVVNPGYTSAEVTAVEVGESEVLLTLAQSVRSGETAGLTYEVPDTGAIRDVDGIAAVGVTWVTTLGASFEGAPSTHDGLSSFKLQLWFSEPVSMSNSALVDSALQVTGGQIMQVRQVNGSGELWELTMMPSGLAAVVLTLPATTDCAAAGAVCTERGKPMSSRLEAVVPGPSEVSITAASSPVTEGTVAVFNVSLSSAASENLTVAVSVTESGSMLSGTPPASVAFSPGDTSVTLSVPTAADSVVEADSVVAAAVATGTGYTVDTASSATVTVEDDDAATFTVTAAPAAIDEGESATLTVAIANGVTLAEVQTVALAVTGTASASDYTGVPAALTLAAGASSATADLTASDDQEEEADETLTVEASLGGVSIGTATVTIASVSHDATLSALSLSGIDIGTFSSTVTSYAASVGHGVESTTVTATASHPEAEVSIAPGAAVSLAAGANAITVRVTAADGETTRTYTVTVERLSLRARDFDGLLGAGNSAPRGLWGNGEVLWVTDYLDSKLYAYARADGGRLPARDVDTFSGARYPTDAWSDGETLWVTDNEFGSAYAYRLADGVRLADRDIALAAANRKPTGVWGDGETLWVLDAMDRRAYAYGLADGTRAADREFALAQPVGAARLSPWGLWSDGEVFHVVSWPGRTSDPTAYAYRDGALAPEADVGDLVNQRASGLWSDGETLWVSEHQGTAKLYAYALPALSSHAALVLLRLAEADLGAFSAAATSYAATVPHSTTRVTLMAHGAAGTAVIYMAADADRRRRGHQADLAVGANVIGLTVTAADGTTTRTYTVTVTRVAVSSADATLAALSLSGIDLGAFAAATTDYSVDVGSTVGATTVTVTANHAGATVVIADAAGSTAGGTRTVALAEGATAIAVTVTAEDGATTATYTVTVTRAAVVPLTAAFEDVPAGHDGTSVFTLTLRFSDALAAGSATTLRDGAVAVGNGTLSSVRRVNGDRALWTLEVTPSGTANVTVSLTADVVCEAGGVCTADGRRLSAVARTTVPATRAPSVSDDATLASLALSDIDIGTFVPDTTSYAAAVAHGVSSTTVTATPNDAAADVTIADANGSTSGTSRSANLAVGTNTLTVTVTAGDGQTQRSYTVTVTRAAAPLTATFEDVPASHDGALAFSFTLGFSEPIQTSFRTLRDENLGVTGGTATRARRIDGSIEWSIEVQPTGSDDVTVWLTADVACAAGGVCTLDGRRLSNAPSVTVPGPASAAPPLSTATVSGTQLTLRYGASLDGGSTPAPPDFVVLAVVAEAASQVRVASVRVVDDTALLTLARPVLPAETVTLSYLEAPMHPLQDVRGRAAAPLTDVAVRNETAARVAAAVPGAATAAALSARAGVLAPPPDLSGWLADGGASAPFGRLDLSARALPEVATLAGLTELRVLNLAGTGIADLAPLSGLTGLEVLDLSSNAITDVGPLSRLTGLERLDLSSNRVADVSALSGLTGLTVLLLDGNEVVDVVSLSVLTELLHLGLSDNRIAEVGLLAELASLRRLNLAGNRVSEVSPLGDLSQLVWLRLPGNPVTDAAPLGRLTQLRWLWLDAGVEGRGLLHAAARRTAAPLWIGVGAPRERQGER